MTVRQGSPSGSATAAVGAGPLEVARIGWGRARAFNVLNRGARSWGGVLIAPWLWPVETAVVARNVGHVRTLGGASMTLSDGTSPRVSRSVVVTAGLLVCTEFAVVLAVAISLAPVLAGSLRPQLAFVAVFAVVGAPLLVELVGRMLRLLRIPEARSLEGRRREFAEKSEGPVYVMTSFVRSTEPGEGCRLLRVLQREWRRAGAVVLLHPANDAVADYYARHGAVPDGDTRLVMLFDYR